MIQLEADVAERLNTAIDHGKTLTAAYVDENGLPHISFYGSTHVHGSDQLAIWVRNPDGALLRTISERPHMAFIYGDISARVYYKFEGKARVTVEADERQRVYDEMHEIERRFDPDAKGVAVIVDLDRFTSLGAGGQQIQER